MKTIEEIIKILEPYTKQQGIFLKTKVEMGYSYKSFWVDFDIASSFESKKEVGDLKALLRKNGFKYQGSSGYWRDL